MPEETNTRLRREYRETVTATFRKLFRASRARTQQDYFDQYNVDLKKSSYYDLVVNELAKTRGAAREVLKALGYDATEIEYMLEYVNQSDVIDDATMLPRDVPSVQPGDTIHASVPVQTLYPEAWNPPRTPDPFIGRKIEIDRIKQALGLAAETPGAASKVIAVHGVPGVGKSTIAARLANDSEILSGFPDGVLWSVLGQPDRSDDTEYQQRRILASWGAALGDEHLHASMSVTDIGARVGTLLRGRQLLLICDDVWDVAQLLPVLRLVEGNIRLFVTSRMTDIPTRVVRGPDGVLRELQGFDENDAIDLLKKVAPGFVAIYPADAVLVVNELQRLPLAINVAGRMLDAEMRANLDPIELIEDLRERMLNEQLPVEMMELADEANSKSIAFWLKRSTRLLDEDARRCFVEISYLVHSPATFGINALEMIEEVGDVKAAIRSLVQAGLVQATSDRRYQMHSLLATLARSMRKEQPIDAR